MRGLNHIIHVKWFETHDHIKGTQKASAINNFTTIFWSEDHIAKDQAIDQDPQTNTNKIKMDLLVG